MQQTSLFGAASAAHTGSYQRADATAPAWDCHRFEPRKTMNEPEDVARLPREPGLFGDEVKPPTTRPTTPGPKPVQPWLLDVNPQDLPGQLSMLDQLEEPEE